jgi:hypothetical protein
MKTIYFFALLALTFGLFACGGGNSANSTNTANLADAKNANISNVNSVSSVTKPSDSTPIVMDYDKISNASADSMNANKGKTLVLKGTLDKWTTSEMKINIGATKVDCKGDFLEYKEAIDLFNSNKKEVKLSFRGTLVEASDANFFLDLMMEDCIITDLQK